MEMFNDRDPHSIVNSDVNDTLRERRTLGVDKLVGYVIYGSDSKMPEIPGHVSRPSTRASNKRSEVVKTSTKAPKKTHPSNVSMTIRESLSPSPKKQIKESNVKEVADTENIIATPRKTCAKGMREIEITSLAIQTNYSMSLEFDIS